MAKQTLKATYHVGKGSAKHNDRSFDTLTNESIIFHNLKNGCYVLDMDTHISHLIEMGEFSYKIKNPVSYIEYL